MKSYDIASTSRLRSAWKSIAVLFCLTAGIPDDAVALGPPKLEDLPPGAFVANTGTLWTAGQGGTLDRRIRVMPGTSPGVGFAFNGNGAQPMWVVHDEAGYITRIQNNGSYRSSFRIAPGSSPVVDTFDNSGFEILYRGANGNLFINARDTGVAIAAGTNPGATSVAYPYSPFWGYPPKKHIRVFQCANTDFCFTSDDGAVQDTHLGMMPGTSPVVTSGMGWWVAAFQANTGNLWTYDNLGRARDTGLGMATDTSPAIAADENQARIAFQANTGNLWLKWADGPARNMGFRMMEGTSPAIAGWGQGGFQVHFQSYTGTLSTWGTNGYTKNLDYGMAPDGSPALYDPREF